MHKYLRAVGFSEYTSRKKIQELIKDVILSADERFYSARDKESVLVEFDKEFAENIGIAVNGEFDDEDNYAMEYYYPYFRSDKVSTSEDISVERLASREAYAGIAEDPRLGVSLIFYLQNMIPYLKLQQAGMIPMKGTSLCLSALSAKGMIMMPIKKNEMQKNKIKRDSAIRSQLIQAARCGDESAIESLTLDDMDTYTSISRRIMNEDIFSLVDTYFMPYGVECDHYSVLGEITDWKEVTNKLTGEKLCQLELVCNEMNLSVCINRKDLFGEPEAGRRFKGEIWLQGFINFPG